MSKLKVITLLFINFIFFQFKPDIMSQTLNQPQLIQEVLVDKDNAINIPFKKYRLPNGLTVILHEDHSDPIVYVDVTYHVGSARETPGRSGFAHFFEHMMFQGSEHVGDEKHFQIVTEAGGTLNGTTNRDRTNYFETLPSNQLETALWLESDRMGFLLDAVTTKKFEIQRATVKNERQQNYDNRPYGLVSEKMSEAFYPFGHPYSWTTIGYLEDIDKFDLQSLKDFFLRWYGPNNATLTIAGSFNEKETLDWIIKYFGSIPKGPEVKNMEKMEVQIPEDRYISYEDNIRFPYLTLTFSSVPSNTKEEAALDALAYLLGGDENKKSPFYQRFIKTQKAMQAVAYNATYELGGQFSFNILAYPNQKLEDIEKEIRDIIDEFDKNPIDEEVFQEYVASEYADLVYGLQSVQRKGSILAYYQTFTGEPGYLKTNFQNIKNLKIEDVRAVFNKYIKNQHAVVLSVYSKDNPNNIAAPNNFQRPKFPDNYKADLSEYQNLNHEKAIDAFDRNIQPKPAANPVIEVPEFWHKIWPNSMKIIGTPYNELPLTNITINLKAGQIFEPIDKAGISTLLADLLLEGTRRFDAEQFQSELKKLGSKINIYTTTSNLTISTTTLNSNIDKTLTLIRDVLFDPRFDPSDFDRLKNQQLEAIQYGKTNAESITSTVEAKILYPDDYILSKPDIGTEKTVSSITLEDVKHFYKQYFRPDHGTIVIVGDIGEKEVNKKLKFLKNLKEGQASMPSFVGVNPPQATTIIFAHKDKSPQSKIKVVGRGLRYDGLGDYYKIGIANFPLGGAFNSRINLNLRERKGWTYGARTAFVGSDYVDEFIVSTSVKADFTDSAVVEIMKDLEAYVQDGITEDELNFTKNSIGQRDALKYETASQKAIFMNYIIKNDFDKDLDKKQATILSELSQSKLDELTRKYIRPDALYIIVVGDRNHVLEPLKKLGYPLQEIELDE